MNHPRARFLALPVLLLLTAFGCKASPQTNTNEQSGGTNAARTSLSLNSNTSVPAATQSSAGTQSVQDLQRLALLFAERYGSYSNQSNFANLEALYPFMTESFAAQTRTFVANERNRVRDTSVYFGVSTKAVSATSQTYNGVGDTAAFDVSTLRTESVATARNSRQYQQILHVLLQRSGTIWRVAGATWEVR